MQFPFITLNSGAVFHYGDHRSRVTIPDIAHHLARIPRYAGATDGEPYVVGQHSVLVHDILESWGASARVRKYGLYHDAHEMLCSDMPTPFQNYVTGLAGFNVIEEAKEALDACIFSSVGLPFPIGQGDYQQVKKADYTALVAEASQLFAERPHWLEEWRIVHDVDASAYDIKVEVQGWKAAKASFLKAAAQYSLATAA